MKQGSFRKRALAWMLTLVMAIAIVPFMPASVALAAPVDLMGVLEHAGGASDVTITNNGGQFQVTAIQNWAGMDIPVSSLAVGGTLEVVVNRITANQMILSTDHAGWRHIAQAYPAGTGMATLTAVITAEILADITAQNPQAVRIRGNVADAQFEIHSATFTPAPVWSAVPSAPTAGITGENIVAQFEDSGTVAIVDGTSRYYVGRTADWNGLEIPNAQPGDEVIVVGRVSDIVVAGAQITLNYSANPFTQITQVDAVAGTAFTLTTIVPDTLAGNLRVQTSSGVTIPFAVDHVIITRPPVVTPGDLVSITAPTVSRTFNQAVEAAAAAEWNLPTTVAIVTDPVGAATSAPVVWNAVSGFDGTLDVSQTLTVQGLVTLPAVITNTTSVDLLVYITINVAAPVTDAIREDVILRSVNFPDYAWINLSTETVVIVTTGGSPLASFGATGAQIQRSVNGGQNWANGIPAPNNAGVNTLFNRATELRIRNMRNPAADAAGLIVLEFPATNARPRGNHASTTGRLAPWFEDDFWTLRQRPNNQTPATGPAGPANDTVLEWVAGDVTNRNRIPAPADRSWRDLPTGGFPILNVPATAAVPAVPITNNVYGQPDRLERGHRFVVFARIAPVAPATGAATPASRVFAVRPATYRRALNLRINYMTEMLPLRPNQQFSVDGGATWTTMTARTQQTVTAQITARTAADDCTAGNILVRVATNGRRPRTANQVIQPLLRADLPTGTVNTLANGRIDRTASSTVGTPPVEVRTLRVENAAGRWVAIPNVPAASTNVATAHTVRVNHTARVVQRVVTGRAASLNGLLHITRDGNRVTEAVITTYGTMPAITVTVSQDIVEINDANLVRTITVGGNATGAVTLDTSNLPANITAEVDGTTITITGVRPAFGGANHQTVPGLGYVVTVTRQGEPVTFAVDVDLTPLPSLTVSASTVTINDGNLTVDVTVTGTATGTITLDTSDLPAGVTATVDSATGIITIEGVRPAVGDGDINTAADPAELVVTREGVSTTILVNVDLTELP